MIRLAHFSDIHLTATKLGWRVRDAFGKRPTGWVNVSLLGRGYRFRHANSVVDVLRTDLAARGYDHLLFTGDATSMAFESEMAGAALRLGVGQPGLPPATAVPGNHDVYTFGAARHQLFEKYFGMWQDGERVDGERYPFAKKVGHVWLVALNTSVPNVFSWDARGRAGAAQLDRLRRLCAKLDAGPRVLVTHYPVLTAKGNPETHWHRLRDWRAAIDTAAACGVGLWVNGHKHRWYVVPRGDRLPFPQVCVGSSAQTGLWAYHEYTIDGAKLAAVRRVFDLDSGTFRDGESFELELPLP